jgi:hypothetical protein
MTHSSDGQITVTYEDVMGNDLTVVNAARVSFGKESKALGWYGPDARPLIPVLSQPDINLINYLAKHKHMSPFGHAFASFHVKAPIFVARQLVKHKFLRWNEISRRYTMMNLSSMCLMCGVGVVQIRSKGVRVLLLILIQQGLTEKAYPSLMSTKPKWKLCTITIKT